MSVGQDLTREVSMIRSIEPPHFDNPTGQRVLIEAADWALEKSLAHILQQAGYVTASCDGPESGVRCRLVAGGGCSGCREADVVVHTLRHSDLRNREVLLEIRKRFPDLPLIVEVPAPRVERYPDDFDGCIVIPQPMTEALLLSALSEALGQAATEA